MPLPGRLLCAMLVILQTVAALSQTLSGEPGSPALLARQGSFVCQVPPRSTELFDPPTTSSLPGAESFVVRQHFRLDTGPASDVAVSWLGATFMQRYGGKIENGVAVAPLQIFTLGGAARDREIMAALAGRHETELSAIWCSLRMQAHGEAGALLTTAVPNVFYARDTAGALGAIDVVWGGAGWEIGASSIEGERHWPAGARVLSRE